MHKSTLNSSFIKHNLSFMNIDINGFVLLNEEDLTCLMRAVLYFTNDGLSISK